jgi:transcriptional regulator with XRE-family HTH domain
MHVLRQLGLNLRRARLTRGLSQENLAFEATVAMNYVSGIERGLRNPTVLVIHRLAIVLSLPIAELFAPVSHRDVLARNLKPGRRARGKSAMKAN